MTMTSDPILDDIFRDLDNADTVELKLNISGEAIARLNEQLHKAVPGSDNSQILAKRILILTELHTRLLHDTDEMAQAPVTMVGELCFILSSKVDPEKLPFIYVGSLLSSVQMSMALTYSVSSRLDADSVAHLAAIVCMLACLSKVTYLKFAEFADLSSYAEDIRLLDKLLDNFSPEDRLFEGNTVTPVMAVDIFYDVLARFAACGFIDKALFED